MFLLFLLVVIGYALYVMAPEERTTFLRAAVAMIRRALGIVSRNVASREPFDEALCARTPWAIVTMALVAVNVLVFVRMLIGDGALSNPETLIAWGANFAPRTTNGEWWRLVATSFVHAGLLHLVINMAALLQVGLVVERLVGHLTFVLVYFTAGVCAGLASLYTQPLLAGVGPSGAIFGIYGLLAGASLWSLLQRSSLTIPPKVLARLAPTAALFTLYNVFGSDARSRPEFAALIAGLLCGLALTKDIGERKPSMRRLAVASAAALVLTAAGAFPQRGTADVRPLIERIVAIEGRTATAYEAAVNQFRLGAIKAEALAQVIDRAIMPELHAAQGRLNEVDRDRVPTEHRLLVADADEYLRLRDESWRLRAEALRKANMTTLRQADRTEWASLEAFKKIKPAEEKKTEEVVR